MQCPHCQTEEFIEGSALLSTVGMRFAHFNWATEKKVTNLMCDNCGLIQWFVAALEGAVVTGGLAALGAGLYSIGIPKNSIVQYETEVKNGKPLLVVHGTADEVERARDLLHQSRAKTTTVHAEPVDVGV